MRTASEPKYFLVQADMLPEIFVKVAKAKELLETGEAATVALVGAEWRAAVAFILLVAILLLRPQGLFGRSEG